MITKFDQIYQKLMRDIQITKTSIKNMNKMTNQEFVQFLQELIPLFKNNTLDLNKLTITQTIQSLPIRLIWQKDDLLFEFKNKVKKCDDIKSSYKEPYKWLYNYLKSKLQQISKKYSNINFKIIGQYTSNQILTKKEKITPILSQHLKNQFGTHGLLQIFSIKQIKNNQLIEIDNTQFRDDILNLSNSELEIRFDELIKNLQFVLDTNNLQNFINIINKSKYNDATNNAIFELKNKLISQLEDLINSAYIKINKSNNKYTFFNSKNQFEDLQNQFLKKVFGYSNKQFIKNIQNKNKYINPWKQNYFNFVNDYGKLLNKLKLNDSILEGEKFSIYQQCKAKFEKLYTIKTFNDFINKIKNEEI